MPTPVVDVRTPQGLREGIAEAITVLRAGGLVAFPTETVYGLGAHALDEAAVRRIFAAKGRPSRNPIIVHVAAIEQAQQLAAEWPSLAQRLAERFWPGPLTLVLPRRDLVPEIVTAGAATVALRIPAHPLALTLLRESGLPIAAPSANRSERLSPTMAEHVRRDLDGRIDLILDGGATSGGIESTVLDVTRSPPRLLRPGLISIVQLEEIAGYVEPPASQAEESALPAPGMLARHYAPRTPLELTTDVAARAGELSTQGLRVAMVSHLPVGADATHMPGDPNEYARVLYATLHEIDDRGVDRIVVQLPPSGEEWRAIHDRLRRAAMRG